MANPVSPHGISGPNGISCITVSIRNDSSAEYSFMITNEFGRIIKFDVAPKSYNIDIDSSKCGRINLFPSNVLDEDLVLHLYFPNMRYLHPMN
jgi:hypothetical protein